MASSEGSCLFSRGVTPMHLEQILLLWFVWERRALNSRALCKRFFQESTDSENVSMDFSENELSWGEIVWMPLVAPDGSVFCNSHIDSTQCRRPVFLRSPPQPCCTRNADCLCAVSVTVAGVHVHVTRMSRNLWSSLRLCM